MTYAIVTIIVLILDQAMKYWATANIALGATGSQCVEIIPGVLQLTNIHNYGAAFNILQNARWLLVVVVVVFAVAVIVLINREIISSRFGKWTAVLVMAGALGNGLDRALYGYVVDMLEFQFMSFPVFNIADMFITVGGILFCLHVIFHKPTAEEAAIKKAAADAPQEEEYVPDYEELSPVARKRKKPEDPYDNIPTRGEHVRDRLAPLDSSDPFAEWEIGFAEQTPAPRGHVEEPEDEYGYDEREYDEQEEDLFSFEQKAVPVKPAAPKAISGGAKPAAPKAPVEREVPKRSASPKAGDDLEEFDLNDILAEFGDEP